MIRFDFKANQPNKHILKNKLILPLSNLAHTFLLILFGMINMFLHYIITLLLLYQASSNSDVKDTSIDVTQDSLLNKDRGFCVKLAELPSQENDFRPHPNSAQKLLSKVKISE